jgi:hypothetical protein
VPPEKLELIHSQDEARKTDVTLISTAYIIRTMQLMEQWGCEAEHWRPIRETMTAAFNKQFLTIKGGTSPRPGHVLYPDSVFYSNNTVTANLLPLALGIVPDNCKEDVVKQIVSWDANPKDNPLTPEVEALLKQLEALGQDTSSMRPQSDPYPERKRTYHYLPYRFDVDYECRTFLEMLNKDYVKDLGLELYFNGDENVTDFYIHCYHYDGHHWTDLGNYYPDFLLIKRREDKIYKVMIIETKGGHLADKFRLRKQFMEGPFLMENNDHFKYDRFDFLYLEDTLSKDERTEKMDVAIKAFFNDKQE